MKVSELIAQLQNAQRLLGDINCDVEIVDNYDDRFEVIAIEPEPSIDPYIRMVARQLI